MTENEKKKGFTQIPNYLLEIIPYFLDTKSAVLLVIIRQTFGWKDRPCHEMSISFFANATGRSQRQVARALKELQDKHIIVNYRQEGNVNVFGLNRHYSEWANYDISVIQKRKGKNDNTYDTSVIPTYDTSVIPTYDTSDIDTYDTSDIQKRNNKKNNKDMILNKAEKNKSDDYSDEYREVMELFQ